MNTKLLIIVILLGSLITLSLCDESDHHDEEEKTAENCKAQPDPLENIRSHLNISLSGPIETGSLEEIIDLVVDRFHCPGSSCDQCINASSVIEGLSKPLDDEQFTQFAINLLFNLKNLTESCLHKDQLHQENSNDWWFTEIFPDSSDWENNLEEFVDNLKEHLNDEEHEDEEEGHGDNDHDDEDEGDHHDDEGEDHHDEEGGDEDHHDDEEGEDEDHHDDEEGEDDHAEDEQEDGDHHDEEEGENGEHHDEEEGEDGDHHDEEEGEDHGDEHAHGSEDDDHAEEELNVKCFDMKDILYASGISAVDKASLTLHQKENVAVLLVMYLMQGYSIENCPPDEMEFLDNVWEAIGLESGTNLPEEGLENLMTQLGIAQATTEPVDEHAGHGHDERKKRGTSRNKRQAVDEDDHGHENDEDKKCYSADQLMTLYGYDHEAGIPMSEFSRLCPALIQQKLQGSCADSHESKKEEEESFRKRFGYGLLAVVIISASSMLGIVMIPCLSESSRTFVMAVFIGLAVGTLVGDAMLHLIPEAFGLHAHDDEHDHGHDEGITVEPYFWKALAMIAAIYGFFVLETLLGKISGHSHSHSHDSDDAMVQSKYKESEDEVEDGQFSGKKEGCCALKPVAWMILLGDGVHNFGDGIAIGAAFSSSVSLGFATAFAVLCHELPHEVGDFAVLLNSGVPYIKAIFFNFFSALTAVLGFLISINIATDEEVRSWMFTVAAGLFIYLALVNMIPELLNMKPKNGSNRSWFICFLLQNLGIYLGVIAMVVIALYEGEIRNIL